MERDLPTASDPQSQVQLDLEVAAIREAQRPTTANTTPVTEISASSLWHDVLVGGQLPHRDGQAYDEDMLPPEMATKQRNYVGKRYRALAEEF